MKDNTNEGKQSVKFTRWLNTITRSIANQLNERINPLSTQSKKVGLLIMGVMMGMICFMLVFKSLQREETSSVLSIDSIKTPKDIFDDEFKSERELFERYNRMIRYKNLIDQLRSRPNGKRLLDSLEKVRPGLRDSVKSFIENYYSN